MSTHFLTDQDGRARAVLLIVVTGLIAMGTTIVATSPAAAAAYAAEAVIDGSAPANSTTEAGWLASCPDVPPSQGVDGHVFELPEVFPANEEVTAERLDSDGPGQPDLGMIFYDSTCNEIARRETVATTEKTQLPLGTKWVLVTVRQSALPATNTTVCMRIGTAFCGQGSASPSASESASRSTSPSASGSASDSSSPSASRSASAGASSTSSASPSPSPSATGTIGTTLESSRRAVRFRKPFTLSGRVEFAPGCEGPFEIALRKRRGGSEESKVFRSNIPVGESQTWRVRVRSRVSATYSAIASSPTCASRPPSAERVLARVAITVGFRRPCAAPQRVTGRVKPRHPRTNVTLRRKSGSRFKTVDEDTLNGRSAYRLIAPTCAGRFKVVWRSQSPKNASGSRRFSF